MEFSLSGCKPGDTFIEYPHPSVTQQSDGLPVEADVEILIDPT